MAFVTSATPLCTRSTFVRCVSRAPRVHRCSIRRGAARMEAAAVDVGAVNGVALPASGVESGSLALSSYGTDKLVVLYFYPRDCTPGCTTEAQDFRDMKDELEKLGAVVVGVSPDDVPSHDNFASKEKLNFPLVSDDGTLADAFGAWKQHPVFGKVINRSTFVLRGGECLREWRGVKATGHAADVLQALKELA